MRRYFSGEMLIPASWIRADEVASTVDTPDGPYVSFLGLTQTASRVQTSEFTIAVSEARAESIAEEAEIFLWVNGSGTPQLTEDFARAREARDKQL